MPSRSALYDQPDSFGWLSIIFHWTTALIIICMWLLGKSIEFQPAEAMDARRVLHVTIGLMVWLPLMVRILWRVISRHPRAQGQSDLVHRVARYTHHLMLWLLTLMLFAGPVAAATLAQNSETARIALLIHAGAANLLAVLVLLHILGALKHLMFNDDETVARMFIPKKRS